MPDVVVCSLGNSCWLYQGVVYQPVPLDWPVPPTLRDEWFHIVIEVDFSVNPPMYRVRQKCDFAFMCMHVCTST